jgi:hypothetical protein
MLKGLAAQLGWCSRLLRRLRIHFGNETARRLRQMHGRQAAQGHSRKANPTTRDRSTSSVKRLIPVPTSPAGIPPERAGNMRRSTSCRVVAQIIDIDRLVALCWRGRGSCNERELSHSVSLIFWLTAGSRNFPSEQPFPSICDTSPLLFQRCPRLSTANLQ